MWDMKRVSRDMRISMGTEKGLDALDKNVVNE
jgi:hypothetical protein